MRPFNKTTATLVRPHPFSTLCPTPLGNSLVWRQHTPPRYWSQVPRLWVRSGSGSWRRGRSPHPLPAGPWSPDLQHTAPQPQPASGLDQTRSTGSWWWAYSGECHLCWSPAAVCKSSQLRWDHCREGGRISWPPSPLADWRYIYKSFSQFTVIIQHCIGSP